MSPSSRGSGCAAQPTSIGNRHALPRSARAVGCGELCGTLRKSTRQVLVGAARVVHRPPHHRVSAHASEQGIDRLLHRTADVHGADPDVPAEIRQFQHRHHAVGRRDRDALGFPSAFSLFALCRLRSSRARRATARFSRVSRQALNAPSGVRSSNAAR
jgi:hypothetical protein